MDPETVTVTYEEHWMPALSERARSDCLPPATLEDLRCLLGFQGIRQRQVHHAEPMQ